MENLTYYERVFAAVDNFLELDRFLTKIESVIDSQTDVDIDKTRKLLRSFLNDQMQLIELLDTEEKRIHNIAKEISIPQFIAEKK